MGKGNPSFYIVGGNINLYSHYEKTVCSFLKNTKKIFAIWSSSPISGYISRENYNSKKYVHPNVHSSLIYNSQDMEIT